MSWVSAHTLRNSTDYSQGSHGPHPRTDSKQSFLVGKRSDARS